MAEKQERIVFPNLSRTRELALDSKQPNPAALLAVALCHENRYYGVMWASYEQMHNFSEADVRFIATLAGQASLAVANVQLLLNVEVGVGLQVENVPVLDILERATSLLQLQAGEKKIVLNLEIPKHLPPYY